MELVVPSRDQQELSRTLVVAAIALIVLCYLGWRLTEYPSAASAAHHAAAHAGTAHATVPPPALYSVVPFALLLLAIALLPLFRTTEHWWEHNGHRLLVASALAALTLLYYATAYGHGVVDHTTHQLTAPGWPAAATVLKNALLVEYAPFMCLLFSLYVISGGIAVEGRLVGRPRLNTALLATGGVLASFIGTTGAAMLLIRPLLKANAGRKYAAHTVVFFIFVVCNTGGCLLPIGDPPLFLGFLRGVPFTWTLGLWPMWLFVNAVLLTVYFAWDAVLYRREDRSAIERPADDCEPLAVRGGINFLWLAAAICCVALLDPSKAVPGTHWHAPPFFRELALLALAALSLAGTRPEVRQANGFNYRAILEVAALFVGIFICMQAPVQLLNTWGPSLGIERPWQFYWGTGMLSGFLDNAPTYVVFFETARSMPCQEPAVAGVGTGVLAAISLGAVFMGAMTYIGNGPNFMVKAIAEAHNVRMPGFFGYMLYSTTVLVPLSLMLTWLFV